MPVWSWRRHATEVWHSLSCHSAVLISALVCMQQLVTLHVNSFVLLNRNNWTMMLAVSKVSLGVSSPSFLSLIGSCTCLSCVHESFFFNFISIYRFSPFPLPYEAGLASGVLPHQQHHGLVVKVGILQSRGVELVKLVAFLQRQQFGFVQLLEPIADRLKDFWFLLPPVVGPKPAEHC